MRANTNFAESLFGNSVSFASGLSIENTDCPSLIGIGEDDDPDRFRGL